MYNVVVKFKIREEKLSVPKRCFLGPKNLRLIQILYTFSSYVCVALCWGFPSNMTHFTHKQFITTTKSNTVISRVAATRCVPHKHSNETDKCAFKKKKHRNNATMDRYVWTVRSSIETSLDYITNIVLTQTYANVCFSNAKSARFRLFWRAETNWKRNSVWTSFGNSILYCHSNV